MVISATFRSFIPKNIGTRIANFVGTKSSKLSQIFKKSISMEGAPKSLRKEPTAPIREFRTHPTPALKPSFHPHPTFSTASDICRQKFNTIGVHHVFEEPIAKTVAHPKRGFSTQAKSNMDMWREKITSKPLTVDMNVTKDLSEDKINALTSLIAKEGIFPSTLVLPRKDLSKGFISNLLNAIKKWQAVLPGIGVENKAAADHPTLSHIFYKGDISQAKKIEGLINQNPPHVWYYEMQNIPLTEQSNVDQFADHIKNLTENKDNLVFLILKDEPDLLLPCRIDPVTNEPDLRPRTLIPSDFFDEAALRKSV